MKEKILSASLATLLLVGGHKPRCICAEWIEQQSKSRKTGKQKNSRGR